MTTARGFFAAAVLLIPAWASAESSALAQLRASAAASERAAYSSSLESASAGNQVWAENAAEAPPPRTVVVPGAGEGDAASPVPSKQSFKADVQAPPQPQPVLKDEEDVPVPPKVRGWEGFKMGFLGTEAQALRKLSK